MKHLNFSEFNSYLIWCESFLVGAQLQDIWTNDSRLVLEFYKFRNLWLVVDLELSHPQIVLLQERAPAGKRIIRPLGLFLHSHGKNLRLKKLKSVPQLGRVAHLELSSLVEGSDVECLIEIQVVPRTPNILVEAANKKISWEKEHELPLLDVGELSAMEGREIEWLDRESKWWTAQQPQLGQGNESNKLIRVIEKKQKALATLRGSLANDEPDLLRQYGTLLSSYQEIPELLKKYSSMSVNDAFEKAKHLERKKIGTQERVILLEAEIQKLLETQSSQSPQQDTKIGSGVKTMKKADARGRKLVLGSNIEAVCGRTAKDNLAILRQARPWDLWLHLKDYPGAHGIIFRNKGARVEMQDIEKVAEWIILESSSAKGFAWGAKYEVIVAETRHVKALRGDTLGRVTYQNAKVYTFASKKK